MAVWVWCLEYWQLLSVVEAVNRGADHMAARRLIAAGAALRPERAADPAFDLRKLALAAKG